MLIRQHGRYSHIYKGVSSQEYRIKNYIKIFSLLDGTSYDGVLEFFDQGFRRLPVMGLIAMVLVIAWAVESCKINTVVPPGPHPNDYDEDSILSGTAENNSRSGQGSRCERIYHNNWQYACTRLLTPMCTGSPQLSCWGSIEAEGVLDTTVRVLKHIFERSNEGKIQNKFAQSMVIKTRQMLINMMRDPQRPVHPAAFFAVIKDFETGANLAQWGRDGKFMCQSRNCSRKCVTGEKACEQWCERHGQMPSPGGECQRLCKESGEYCDNRCYGLFQVDPEFDNFRPREAHDPPDPYRYVLWDPKHIRWDYKKICGDEGLGIIKQRGGPDYCALLYWFTEGLSGHNCAGFVDPDLDGIGGDNPCTTEGATWSVETFRHGHRAYGQEQSDELAWQKRYEGFRNTRGEMIQGYEHCAASGYEGYHYQNSSDHGVSLLKALQASVMDFGCRVGVMPPWANFGDCE